MRALPRFSVQNPVLVGVLMTALIIGGLYGSMTLVREMFPESRPNLVIVSTAYPGASPEEVERGIALRFEEAVQTIDNIQEIKTTVAEGLCTITLEFDNDLDDIDQAVIDVKNAIDAIPRDELPEQAEEPVVAEGEPLLPVISVAIYGDADEHELKQVGEDVREDLLQLPGVTEVSLSGVRKAELTVEIEPQTMAAYRLSLADIAGAIREANLDLPGGQVKTRAQNISLRTLGETDEAERIEDTIVLTDPNGAVVRVRDLGRVIDAFEDTDTAGRYNDKPAVDITVQKKGDQDAIEIADKVRAYVAGRLGEPLELTWFERLQGLIGIETTRERIYARALNDPLPDNLNMGLHNNLVRFIESRLDLLQRNGAMGLTLVFLSLLIFLNWRVAFWVLMGLIVSICGAIILMSFTGTTLNLITMFGLIVVLGIIVDDAIVAGENIYARFEQGESPDVAAVHGAQQVAWPVTIAVLTTIAAFAPLMFIDGRFGDFMGQLPIVVMCALSVSLIESLMILPSHLSESLRKVKRPTRPPARDENAAQRDDAPAHRPSPFAHLLSEVLPNRFERFLRVAANWRYVTLAVATAALIAAVGLVIGGRLPVVFLQKMESETLLINVEMPLGTPAEETGRVMKVVEQAVMDLPDEERNNVYTLLGGRLNVSSDSGAMQFQSHLGQSILELTSLEYRDRSSEDIKAELRAKTADLVGVKSLKFEEMSGGPGGAEIQLEITSEDLDALLDARNRLKQALSEYAGVYDIADNYESGRRELRITLLDSARPLNITTRSLATEVRGAFFGLEARTIQRQREDVDIRVRFPEEQRGQVASLESLRVKTPMGDMVPLTEVARIEDTRGYATINRIDQRRAVTVTADVDKAETSDRVLAALPPLMAQLEREHPGLRVDFAGNKRELAKSLNSLYRDSAIAIMIIYVMLCGLFGSYLQPLVVLAAVPFGITGALVGHYLLGYPLTLLSFIGIVALIGIVVNDSLILVDFVNTGIRSGKSVFEAVISAGRRRLRPILLTSLTTILGLLPLLAEQSFQARFLIPMAISISFGLLFATVLTLVVVPSLFLILEDFKRLVRRPTTAATLEHVVVE